MKQGPSYTPNPQITSEVVRRWRCPRAILSFLVYGNYSRVIIKGKSMVFFPITGLTPALYLVDRELIKLKISQVRIMKPKKFMKKRKE